MKYISQYSKYKKNINRIESKFILEEIIEKCLMCLGDKMPLKRLKYTVDYCRANPIGFINRIYKFFEQLCRCTYNQI